MTKRPDYDKQHLKNLTQYEQQVAALMEQTQRLIANTVWALVGDTANTNDEPFLWDDHQMAKMRMEQMVSQLNANIQQTIENGISLEWQLSNTKNDDLVRTALGDYLAALPEERRSRYLNNHDEARQAFLQRKVNGMGLSERVWDLSAGYKEELEMGISVALKEGTSAATLSKKLCQYLKNPEALYRRVRGQYGELELSKHARAYHPGQGVYRSAYKNAIRLAGTEINIAYRTSDYDRWQAMDFVVGIEVEPSNTNHKDYDICNTLAGKYPKEFKFTGWHPNCRCHATPILKTDEEMQRDRERIIQGKEPVKESENGIDTVPKNFEQWVKQSQRHVTKRANTLPYFLKDNGQVNNKGVYKVKTFPKVHKDAPISLTTRGNASPDKVSLTNAVRRSNKEAAKELQQWFVSNAPLTVAGGCEARRFAVQVQGETIIINKRFVKETISKHSEDALYQQKLRYALQAPVLLPKSKYIRTEQGKDHKEQFKVYEYQGEEYRAEFKVKCNSDEMQLYVMRLYKQKTR